MNSLCCKCPTKVAQDSSFFHVYSVVWCANRGSDSIYSIFDSFEVWAESAHLSTKSRTRRSSGLRAACARATSRSRWRASRCSLNAPPAPLMLTRPMPLSRPSTWQSAIAEVDENWSLWMFTAQYSCTWHYSVVCTWLSGLLLCCDHRLVMNFYEYLW